MAVALRAAGERDVRAWSRPRADAAAASVVAARLDAAGVAGPASLEETVSGAEAVLVAVPAGAAAETARACAGALPSGALYVDLTAAGPATKEQAADLIDGAGGAYVDVAILGTVAVSGAAVPMLACGRGAERWRALAEPRGLRVRAVEEPAGHASRVKLLRSAYLKGRDALVIEMLLAARRHGLEEAVIESIGGPGEGVSFEALAERVVCALAVHAQRRADELAGSCELLEEVGIEPLVAGAATERLRRVADLGLRELYDGRRPASGRDVLATIEARLGSRGC